MYQWGRTSSSSKGFTPAMHISVFRIQWQLRRRRQRTRSKGDAWRATTPNHADTLTNSEGVAWLRGQFSRYISRQTSSKSRRSVGRNKESRCSRTRGGTARLCTWSSLAVRTTTAKPRYVGWSPQRLK
uniref:Uncharacterized protein n=1 Tax=Human herpesvirus 2 TaxID=10310 RepID=A0A481TBP7_HHV2|nr:hypothetical protein [Human alphaherpesvirus 2]